MKAGMILITPRLGNRYEVLAVHEGMCWLYLPKNQQYTTKSIHELKHLGWTIERNRDEFS